MSLRRNIRCTVAYRGTHFHGFAENADVRTVSGELRSALEQVLREPIEINVAGRTDAGVHATGQVISFLTTSYRFDSSRLQQSLNRLCAPDIVVRSLEEVPEDFDARFSASERSYRYTVLNSRFADPLMADLEWHVPEPLDVAAMNAAAAALVGEHDFTSFCRRPKDRPDASLVREVRRATWRRVDRRLVFDVSANAFCHQMVRSLVGFCVSVGRGAHTPSDVPAVLAARDRSAAAPIAPPVGLVLVDVVYASSGADRRCEQA